MSEEGRRRERERHVQNVDCSIGFASLPPLRVLYASPSVPFFASSVSVMHFSLSEGDGGRESVSSSEDAPEKVFCFFFLSVGGGVVFLGNSEKERLDFFVLFFFPLKTFSLSFFCSEQKLPEAPDLYGGRRRQGLPGPREGREEA